MPEKDHCGFFTERCPRRCGHRPTKIIGREHLDPCPMTGSVAGPSKCVVIVLISWLDHGVVFTICSRGIDHDILDFCVRKLVTVSVGGVERKMAIIVLVNHEWDHNETANSLEHVSLMKLLGASPRGIEKNL